MKQQPAPAQETRSLKQAIVAASQRYQFVAFVIAAGLSVPVNLLTRIAFSRVVPFEVAVVLSHVCGMLTAFALTKLFVFSPSGRTTLSELSRFTAVNVVSLAVTWIVAVGLLRLVLPGLPWIGQPEFVAHVTGLGVSAVTSFVGHKHFSFARSRLESATQLPVEKVK